MWLALRNLAFAAALLVALSGNAEIISGTAYDPARDELVVDILYLGTDPNHEFSLVWDECSGTQPPYEVAARLIDQQGFDAAEREFRVRRRFSLAGLKCRPARVGLHLGRYVTSVFIPARPAG
jgi:hypothetical protein